MNNPVSILDVLGDKLSEDKVDVRLQAAYAAFMAGNPSREDCSIIAVDLAFYSGYYNTSSEDTPAEVLKYREGRRDVFGRIVRYANMPLAELNAIHAKAVEIQLATGDFNA